MLQAHSLHATSMGLEEEFFVVDACTGELSSDDWAGSVPTGNTVDVTSELFKAMIEVRTAPHSSIAELLREQRRNRRILISALSHVGKALLACGTHPTANWRSSPLEEQDR